MNTGSKPHEGQLPPCVSPWAPGAEGDDAASFVERAHRLDRLGQTDAALDVLYDALDDLMRRGEPSQIDRILCQVNPADLSADLLLGLLTATLPCKTRLPARTQLFTEIQRVLKERGEFEEELLAGLEG